MDSIRIRGARTHNLRNVSLDIPRDRLVVITGLSGSGKSSLAFDTLYAEGQRRYVESLSAYARQFLELMEKPDVDLIEGLSPAIAIEQKAASHNPRSTVGKGEHVELFEELRAQGFTRVRVDGALHELEAAPRLAKNLKHSVEVVVDRLRARADLKQRLAESIETALRHADGRAIALETDTGKEHLFSAKFACPVCSYSLAELEP